MRKFDLRTWWRGKLEKLRTPKKVNIDKEGRDIIDDLRADLLENKKGVYGPTETMTEIENRLHVERTGGNIDPAFPEWDISSVKNVTGMLDGIPVERMREAFQVPEHLLYGQEPVTPSRGELDIMEYGEYRITDNPITGWYEVEFYVVGVLEKTDGLYRFATVQEAKEFAAEYLSGPRKDDGKPDPKIFEKDVPKPVVKRIRRLKI